MLSKQILILSLIFPLIEFYCFVAVRKSIRRFSARVESGLWVFYIFLSVLVILAFFALRYWGTSQWPSLFLKHFINTLIGVFLGKFLIAIIMLAGDCWVALKALIVTVKTLFAGLVSRLTKINKVPDVQGIRISRSEFIAKTALVSGAAFTGLLGYGRVNKYNYKIHKVPLKIKNLPVAWQGMKIIQLSDIHTGSLDNRDAVAEGIRSLMAEKPDLILFTGDLVNYRAAEVVPFLEILGSMQAPLGIYSVLGNHDYGDYISWPTPEARIDDFNKLLNYQRSMGWKVLRNENVGLDYKGSHLTIIGVDNWSIKARFPRYGDLDKAMKGVDSLSGDLKILMSHDPSHWDAEVRPYYPYIQLTLSGHTHGMQMGIEIPGIKWSPSQYLYKQWAGLYMHNDQYLYVNRGYGYLGYEGRLGILPEITVFELA